MKLGLQKAIIVACLIVIIFCVLLLSSIATDVVIDHVLKPSTLFHNMIFSAIIALGFSAMIELYDVKILMYAVD